jgi:hypothetical protein
VIDDGKMNRRGKLVGHGNVEIHDRAVGRSVGSGGWVVPGGAIVRCTRVDIVILRAQLAPTGGPYLLPPPSDRSIFMGSPSISTVFP